MREAALVGMGGLRGRSHDIALSSGYNLIEISRTVMISVSGYVARVYFGVSFVKCVDLKL